MKARDKLGGDPLALDALAASLLVPRRDNLVPRPWGGSWIHTHKGLPAPAAAAAAVFGEAFELAASDADPEAAAYPSRLRLDDGTEHSLPELLARHGERLLGSDFLARHGPAFPLLPKILDVKELLSVQGHPAGHTEVYIIIDCEPGATLRLGFNRDVDPAALARDLSAGLEAQRALLALLGDRVDPHRLQAAAAAWFADRGAAGVSAELTALLPGEAPPARAERLLVELKERYWQLLDVMNAIPVERGQVIYNATPARYLRAPGQLPSAEVHALGNPERREILALEIRRPGPTFRAWDNVRFPLRPVNVAEALAALNLSATTPEDFVRERKPERPGLAVSVDTEFFRVEHLEPAPGSAIDLPAASPHSLHVLSGAVGIERAATGVLTRLGRGDSALVPFEFGPYRVTADEPAEVVRVLLPAD